MIRLGALVLIFAAFFPHPAEALETSLRTDIQASGLYRHINQEGFSSISDSLDLVFLSGSRLRLSQGDFLLEVEPQLRGLSGRSANLPQSDPAFLTVRSPDRFMDLRVQLGNARHAEWYLDVERLNLSFTKDALDAYIGRKPVGLGVLKIFPVWNKFTRPLPGISGPTIIYGSDGAGVQVQAGELSVRGLQIVGRDASDDVSLAELVWYSPWIELHFLASYWWQEYVIGAAAAKDLGGMTARAEVLGIGLRASDPEQQIQAGLGGEYAFDEKWSAIAETYLQSAGATSVLDYPLISSSRFSTLRALAYGYGAVEFKATPYWTFTLGSLTNFVDWGSVAILRAQDSLSDNLDLFLEGNVPAGREGAEFSSRSFLFSDGSSLGTPLQFSAGLKAVF